MGWTFSRILTQLQSGENTPLRVSWRHARRHRRDGGSEGDTAGVTVIDGTGRPAVVVVDRQQIVLALVGGAMWWFY